jgi:LemA protein
MTTRGVLWPVVLAALVAGCDNEIIAAEQRVNQSFGDLQSQYQRRADLVPNLVEVVKASAAQEQATLEKVMQARASATSVRLDAADLSDPAKVQAYQAAQAGMSGALRQLLAVSEAYPDLKASQGFRDLQVQLEGTENRIARAREVFNGSVTTYNTSILQFPGRLWAGARTTKQVFEADVAALNAPKVKF